MVTEVLCTIMRKLALFVCLFFITTSSAFLKYKKLNYLNGNKEKKNDLSKYLHFKRSGSLSGPLDYSVNQVNCVGHHGIKKIQCHFLGPKGTENVISS